MINLTQLKGMISKTALKKKTSWTNLQSPIDAHFCHHVDKYEYWKVFRRFRPFLDSTGVRRQRKRLLDNGYGSS